jgi:metal-sulfur cluster biosynthetic enzyme
MDDRLAEVWDRLARVTDPEIDEPVTELGFVTGATVTGDGRVRLDFRLPTYWCAANFAFLMAEDMRREVSALSWVTGVDLTIGEHMFADAINRGMTEGLSFQAAFPDQSDGDLGEVRRIFAVKSFQRRQNALLRHLRAAGHTPAALLALTVAALASLPVDAEGQRLITRYLERREIPGPFDAEAAAFVDMAGARIMPATFDAHLRALDRVAINAEFNGALCRGLLAARFDEREKSEGAEPSLLDFIRRLPQEKPAAGA